MAEQVKILYVDASLEAREAFARLFREEEGYRLFVVESAARGLETLAAEPDVQLVIADFQLAGLSGVNFLAQVAERWTETLRVVLAGYADTEPVIEAIGNGQIDKFFPKPWHAEELKSTLITILQHRQLQQQNVRLQKKLQRKSEQFDAVSKNLEKLVAQRTEALEIRNRVLRIAQGVLDVLPVAVFGIDGEQLIVQCNDQGRDLFPAGFMGPLGINRHEVFPAEVNRVVDLLESERAPSAQVVIKAKPYRVEVRRMDEALSEGVVLLLIPE